MVKIIWILIGINSTALLVLVVLFFLETSERNVGSMEKGWSMILGCIGLLVILLAAIPLRYSQSVGTIIFSGFFAALPLAILLGVFISKRLPSFKKHKTLAQLYFNDAPQRAIADAIVQNDTVLLKEIIKGHDLNIKGNIEMDGLSYLQFAVMLWRNKGSYVLDEKALGASIRILVENGSKTTPALSAAVKALPPELIMFLLDNGADPNTYGYANNDPLLFECISTKKEQNDMGILLVKRGANVNALAKNNYDLTPAMFAANNARTSSYWNDVWRLIKFFLEEGRADYTYQNKDGNSLQMIIRKIREDATKEQVTMHPDFYKVVEWLTKHQVNTEPVKNKQDDEKEQ